MTAKPRVIAVSVLAGLVLILLLQNTQVVTLRLLFWKVEMSRVIFIPFVMLVGFAAGFVAGRMTAKKQQKAAL